jgi:hypothetical protein
MALRSQQRHGCAKTKFGIIWMRRNNRDIHGVLLQFANGLCSQ